MKNKKTLIIITIVLVAGIASWFLFLKPSAQQVVLSTEKPQTGYISETVTATGTVEPVDTVAVGTQVSGTISKIFVDFNSTVKKGQLLADLDKTLFQASVDQFASNLAQAQSQLVYQEGNFSRQKQLYEAGAISKADYDNALYTYNAAKASVSSIAAQLRSAQKNLSLASIYSPIDGTILSRDVSVGQTVAASFSTPTLFVIAKDITKMQVKANVDEADIGNVADSQRATFTVDAFINDVFKGNVQEIRLNPTTSSNVVTYTTLINAPNDDKKLKPGMTANITIYTKEEDNALLVPAKALKYKPDSSLAKDYHIMPIQETGGGPSIVHTAASTEGGVDSAAITGYVWVKQDKSLVQKKVITGLNNNTQVQILSGLSANDEIVTSSEISSDAPEQSGTSSPFMPKRPGSNSKKG